MMIRTGKRMTECQEYLYILHGVTFTKNRAQDKSVLFHLTAWSENNQ